MDNQTREVIRRRINEAMEQAGLRPDAFCRKVAEENGGDARVYRGAVSGKSRSREDTWCELAEYLEKYRHAPGIVDEVNEIIRRGALKTRQESSGSQADNTVDPRSKYEGAWTSFRAHLPRDARCPVVSKRQWSVRKREDGNFVVESKGDGVMYSGVLHCQRDFCIVRLSGKDHDEEILIRLHDPIPPHIQKTFGLYLSMAFSHHSIAGPIAISRSHMSDDEVLEYLRSKHRVVENPETQLRIMIDDDAGGRS